MADIHIVLWRCYSETMNIQQLEQAYQAS
jgi:hypothetical protein